MSKFYDLNNDIETLLLEYPLLSYSPPNKIEGTVTLITDDGFPLQNFELQILIPKGFPFTFPLVTETGGFIPRSPERHIFPTNNNLCLGVLEEIFIKCKQGITLIWFMENVLLPRLAEEYLVDKGGKYQREYSHGVEGVWEFYQGLFKSSDRRLILSLIEMSLGLRTILKNTARCPCGGGKKFTKCHRRSVFELDSYSQQGRDFWIASYQTLKNLHLQ